MQRPATHQMIYQNNKQVQDKNSKIYTLELGLTSSLAEAKNKVFEFRRSWDVEPEPLNKENPYHPIIKNSLWPFGQLIAIIYKFDNAACKKLFAGSQIKA